MMRTSFSQHAAITSTVRGAMHLMSPCTSFQLSPPVTVPNSTGLIFGTSSLVEHMSMSTAGLFS